MYSTLQEIQPSVTKMYKKTKTLRENLNEDERKATSNLATKKSSPASLVVVHSSPPSMVCTPQLPMPRREMARCDVYARVSIGSDKAKVFNIQICLVLWRTIAEAAVFCCALLWALWNW
mmetsp:Transcript_4676/g.8012  ORF Transcript_4676/g.8012 Transcript_4676/m.8012 type:complete len:119 (+) Transcript_4676:695-1051(+)